MLTSIAILERELGSNDYARHSLRRRVAAAEEDGAEALLQEIEELERRREKTLRLLEELHEERAGRQPDAGRGMRARPPGRRR